MSKENKELNEEVNETPEESKKLGEHGADDVSGGAIFYAGRWAGDKKHKWEVLDDTTGNVLGRYNSKQLAEAEALNKDVSTERYHLMSSVNKKRDAYKQHAKFEDVKKSDSNFENPF